MWSSSVIVVIVCLLTAGQARTRDRRWAEDDHVHFQLHNHTHVHDHEPTTATPETRETREIPLELLMQLSSVNNLNDFITNFVDNDSIKNETEDDPSDFLGNRFGGDDERKSVHTPKQAACTPELKVVSLKGSDNPSLFYYPFCTRIERCGGCCASGLLSCQPTQTEIVNFQVVVTEYKGGKQMQFKGKEIIPVERHTQCKCDCAVKEDDCNQFQEYRKNDCRCVCLNVDEEQKCLSENDTKLWDPHTCSCECRETTECSTGYYYDQNTCSCAQVPKVRSRSALPTRQRRGEVPINANSEAKRAFLDEYNGETISE